MLREELINISQNHEKFLQAQRNFSAENIGGIIKSHEKYHLSIINYLPKKCTSVLDIGCGLGFTDLCIFEHYGSEAKIQFYLFDKSEFADDLYFGFEDKPAFYNDLKLAKKLLTDYGVSSKCVDTIEAEKENLSQLKDIDLIISAIAWGFHFPVSTYLEEVVNLMHDESVLIMDIRKESDGLERLRELFNVEIILQGSKSIRVACRKSE